MAKNKGEKQKKHGSVKSKKRDRDSQEESPVQKKKRKIKREKNTEPHTHSLTVDENEIAKADSMDNSSVEILEINEYLAKDASNNIPDKGEKKKKKKQLKKEKKKRKRKGKDKESDTEKKMKKKKKKRKKNKKESMEDGVMSDIRTEKEGKKSPLKKLEIKDRKREESSKEVKKAKTSESSEPIPTEKTQGEKKPPKKKSPKEFATDKKKEKAKSVDPPETAASSDKQSEGDRKIVRRVKKIIGGQAWREDSKVTAGRKFGHFSKKEDDHLINFMLKFGRERGYGQNFDEVEQWAWPGRKGKMKYGGLKQMWLDLAQELHRSMKSVYSRARILFIESKTKVGKWSKEEEKKLRELVEEYGTGQWRIVAMELGRFEGSVGDKWKWLREPLGGRWSVEEDKKLKAAILEVMEKRKEKKATQKLPIEQQGDEMGLDETETVQSDSKNVACKEAMVRFDNFQWAYIASKVGTRGENACQQRWYRRLCPSMISTDEWGPRDDRRLLKAMWLSGARYEFELNWPKLVPDRTEEQIRRRWVWIRRTVKNKRDIEFRDMVGTLVKEHAPKLWEKLEDNPGMVDEQYLSPMYRMSWARRSN